MGRGYIYISPQHIGTGRNTLFKLIECSIRSSQYPSFIVDKGTKKEVARAGFNLIILGHKGVGKSSLLLKIAKWMLAPIITDFTVPGLIGSIEKGTGEVIPGTFWRHRRKCILFDEFWAPDVLKTMNAAIEQGIICRQLGFAAKTLSEKPQPVDIKEGLSIAVNKGEVTIITRFSFICAALRHPLLKKEYSPDVDAFCSRAVTVEWIKETSERWEEIEKGHKDIQLPKLTIPNKKAKKPLKISNKDWRRLLDWCKKQEMPDENLERCILDMARYYAIMGFDEEVFNIIRRSHSCKRHYGKKQ